MTSSVLTSRPIPDNPVVVAIGQSWDELTPETEVLKPHGIRLVDGRRLGPTDTLWRTAAGILLGSAGRIDAAFLARVPQCAGIVRYGIGYDNIDVAGATGLGIVVAIVRDYCIDEVAEHAIASALALARALPYWERNIRAGRWRAGDTPHVRRLADLTFGVVGFGLIGRAAAAKSRGLFRRIAVHDPWATIGEAERALGYDFHADIGAFLRASDIVSVHVPLTERTRSLIGRDAIATLKPGSIVINVSRGGIVDEEALIDALRSGHLAGAALDTFEREPLPADSPLLDAPNLMLTPHVAWLSDEAARLLRRRAAEEMALILTGHRPSAPVGVAA